MNADVDITAERRWQMTGSANQIVCCENHKTVGGISCSTGPSHQIWLSGRQGCYSRHMVKWSRVEIGLSSARLEVRCSLASQEKRGRERCVFLFTRPSDTVDIHFWVTISKTSGLYLPCCFCQTIHWVLQWSRGSVLNKITLCCLNCSGNGELFVFVLPLDVARYLVITLSTGRMLMLPGHCWPLALLLSGKIEMSLLQGLSKRGINNHLESPGQCVQQRDLLQPRTSSCPILLISDLLRVKTFVPDVLRSHRKVPAKPYFRLSACCVSFPGPV